METLLTRLSKRAKEIEDYYGKNPGMFPEAIQHAADLRMMLALLDVAEPSKEGVEAMARHPMVYRDVYAWQNPLEAWETNTSGLHLSLLTLRHTVGKTLAKAQTELADRENELLFLEVADELQPVIKPTKPRQYNGEYRKQYYEANKAKEKARAKRYYAKKKLKDAETANGDEQ